MPLNITTGSLSAKGFGFTNLGLVRLTTGAEQEIFATSLGSRSAAIQLANGNIVTGSYIQSSNNQGLRYKALTVINSTAVYGSEQTASYNNCFGGTNATDLASGNIVSGRQMSHAEDGTNSYTGGLGIHRQTFRTWSNYNSAKGLSPIEQVKVADAIAFKSHIERSGRKIWRVGPWGWGCLKGQKHLQAFICQSRHKDVQRWKRNCK